ncbi:MAG: protein kinase [Planctomycetota bacterium]
MGTSGDIYDGGTTARASGERAEPASLNPGTLVADRYLIAQTLGAGGEGTVYACVDTKFGTAVAIKVSGQADRESRGRLRREARIGNVLGGSLGGVVRCLDWGELDHGLYIVLDLVDGAGRLDVDTGPIPARLDRFERAVEIVTGVHQRGVVHRDLKPANFLVTLKGDIYLSDFGLAKEIGTPEVAGEDSDLTVRGIAMGTPAYMPLEQFEDARTVDFRADVFALGAMLFRLLTGAQPYGGGDSVKILTRQMNVRQGLAKPPRPRDRNRRISPGMDELCAHALELDRERRIQSSAELLERLRALRSGPQTRSTPRPSSGAISAARSDPSSGRATSGEHAAPRRPGPPRSGEHPAPPRRASSGEHPAPPRRATSGEQPRPRPPAGPSRARSSGEHDLPPRPAAARPAGRPPSRRVEPADEELVFRDKANDTPPSAMAIALVTLPDGKRQEVRLGSGTVEGGVRRCAVELAGAPAHVLIPSGSGREHAAAALELQILGRVLEDLRHPGAVRAVGRIEGGLVVEALTPLPRLPERGFPLSLALNLGLDLLGTLTHLHARGFAHARLDPTALALRGASAALDLHGLSPVVQSGAAVGVLADLRSARSLAFLRDLARGQRDPDLGPPASPAPAYAPPELGAAGDVYAAGLLLHTWISGVEPFAVALKRGEDLAALRRAVARGGADPLEASPVEDATPRAIGADLARLLADMVGQRSSAEQAWHRLRDLAESRPAGGPEGPLRQAIV